MGYTTQFSGKISLSRKLTMAEAKTLLTWADDPDTAPQPHPRSYLQWVPSKELDAIGWDGNEKFYEYEAWLQWVCDWLGQQGIAANGTLYWSGEDSTDNGMLSVVDNKVEPQANKADASRFEPIDLRDLADMALAAATA